MTRLYRAAVLLLFCIFFYQCQKDLSYYGSPDTGFPGVTASDPIKATLQGNIVDENEQPAPGVSITVGTKTVMTNGSGYFRITGASLDKNTSFIIAQKEGYFKGYRVFAATSGTNQVVIKLIKKNLAGTITASSGGSATLSNGAKISLPANSVVLASAGSAYTGDVNVYAAYIDPKADDIAETVPGSFAANDKNGKGVILASYGMLAVELASPAGEKLQIKAGAVATLTTPIPSTSLSSAPATIAMWYVDEQTGVWKEEGTATKQGNNYMGDVKHFSFWNYDYPYDAVNLSMTIQTSDGSPLVSVAVKITTADSLGAAYGYTDSLGQVKGLVPANKHLLLEVFDPCNNIIYTKNISPLSANTNLGVVTIPNSTPSLLTLSGILLNCSGAPVKNGYAIINFNNIFRYAATNDKGKFSNTFIICSGSSATTSVIGVDDAAQQQSITSTVSVTAPVTDAGNIKACGISAAQFINYTLDGTDYSLASIAKDTIMGYTYGDTTIRNSTTNTRINGFENAYSNNNFGFIADNTLSAGTFSISSIYVQNYYSIKINQPFKINFTKFANVSGEFYEGTLSGKFTDSFPILHTVSATFKVRRNN